MMGLPRGGRTAGAGRAGGGQGEGGGGGTLCDAGARGARRCGRSGPGRPSRRARSRRTTAALAVGPPSVRWTRTWCGTSQVRAPPAGGGRPGVPAYVDRDPRVAAEPEAGHVEQVGGPTGQRLAERGTGVVGPEVDDGVDRDPALDARLGGAVVQPHQLALAAVRVREAVRVRGQHVVAVPDRGADQVDQAGARTRRGRAGLHRRGRTAEQHRGGVEEVHAVLDEDAAAEPLVPEPVVVAEVLVAGVVLEQEPLRRRRAGRPAAGSAPASSGL